MKFYFIIVASSVITFGKIGGFLDFKDARRRDDLKNVASAVFDLLGLYNIEVPEKYNTRFYEFIEHIDRNALTSLDDYYKAADLLPMQEFHILRKPEIEFIPPREKKRQARDGKENKRG